MSHDASHAYTSRSAHPWTILYCTTVLAATAKIRVSGLTACEDEDAEGGRRQERSVKASPLRTEAAVRARGQRVQQERVLERHLLQAVVDAAGPEVALQVALRQCGASEHANSQSEPTWLASPG